MANQISGTNETNTGESQVDPWVAAFAALEPKSEEPAATDPGNDAGNGESKNPEGASGQEVPAAHEASDGNGNEGNTGELDPVSGDGSGQNGVPESSDGIFDQGVSQEQIDKFEADLDESIRNKAINDVAQEFIKRGIRNHNGQLGATLDDSDICKRDEDGVPHFYNPETGQEFRGDNPRRQAQEWVDDYNKELARVFNNTCEQYENQLKKDSEPQVAVMKFAPKYEKLDDIRRGMFDNVIQDYELRDNDGKLIGYSCDLDKALSLVDRQIAMIQSYAKQHQSQQQAQQPTGPALDMKTSSGAVQADDTPVKSLEDAMLRIQNQQLEKLKKN